MDGCIPQNGQGGFKELESKKEWVRWVWPRRSRVITTSSLREELWNFGIDLKVDGMQLI